MRSSLNWKIALLLRFGGSGRGTEPFKSLSIGEYRKTADMNMLRLTKRTSVPVHVEDFFIQHHGVQLPVRLYTPEAEGPFPIILFYHGGGFVVGSIDTHDPLCRTIAYRGNAAVLSVGYRLAPENPFPAAVEDSYAAYVWVKQNYPAFGGNPDKIVLAGDSAGGNLAAVTAHLAKNNGDGAVKMQILIYPSTNGSDVGTDSHKRFGRGYYLTTERVEWFRDQYIPPAEDAADPLASPLLADDFSGLPPALVVTAEFDPLRDEGRAYAEKLRKAGVPVRYMEARGMIHGFLSMTRIVKPARDILRTICREVKNL